MLELPEIVYILEFKMTTQRDPAAAALQQIRERGYDQSFQGRGKRIVLLGSAFDQSTRTIADWQMEEISQGVGASESQSQAH